jgi:sugar phosphate isomerase/epimerase
MHMARTCSTTQPEESSLVKVAANVGDACDVGQGGVSRRHFFSRSAAIGAMLAGGVSLPQPWAQTASAQQTSENPWQIGCYTRPWGAYDYRVALDGIAEAGFRYVGLMTANTPSHLILSATDSLEYAAQVADEVKQRRLEILSLFAGDPAEQEREKAAAHIRHGVDLCVAIGSPMLLLCGTENPKCFGAYVQAMGDVCDYAAEKRIQMTLKPHGLFNGNGPQLRRIVECIHHKSLSVWYDAGNVYYYSAGKLNPVEDAATVDGLVSGWSIKDYTPPATVDVAIGAGLVDFAGVFARLKLGGFQKGPLIVETLSPGNPAELLAEAKKARVFLEDLIRNNGKKSETEG